MREFHISEIYSAKNGVEVEVYGFQTHKGTYNILVYVVQ